MRNVVLWLAALLCVVHGYECTGDTCDEVMDLIPGNSWGSGPGIGSVKILSWSPRIFQIDNFLSPEECDYMLDLGRKARLGHMAVYTEAGEVDYLPNTVSSTTTPLNYSDPVVHAMRERIATFTHQPIENHEKPLIINYKPGQFFRGHLDAHAKKGRISTSRLATFFIYLVDVAKGGETYFPLGRPIEGGFHPEPSTCKGVGGKDPTVQTHDEMDAYIDGSEMYTGPTEGVGVIVKPKRGMAVLWYNLLPNGTCDLVSRHAGCPLVEGEKWTITEWIHNIPHAEAEAVGARYAASRPDPIKKRGSKVKGCPPGPERYWIAGTIYNGGFFERLVEESKGGRCRWREINEKGQTYRHTEVGVSEDGRIVLLKDGARNVKIKLMPFKMMWSKDQGELKWNYATDGFWSDNREGKNPSAAEVEQRKRSQKPKPLPDAVPGSEAASDEEEGEEESKEEDEYW